MNLKDLQLKLRPVLHRHGVQRASVFGSVARGSDKSDSDVDLLVKFGKPTGLVGYVKLVDEIEEVLNRKVDLVTEGGVNKYIEPYIKSDLKIIYEE